MDLKCSLIGLYCCNNFIMICTGTVHDARLYTETEKEHLISFEFIEFIELLTIIEPNSNLIASVLEGYRKL